MDPSKILESMRAEFGSMVDVALLSVERRARRTSLAVGLCVLTLVAGVGSTAAVVAMRTEATKSAGPPLMVIVEAIQGLPSGSSSLACFASALVSCGASLDNQQLAAAISCVGRSGLGPPAEGFIRSALLSPDRSVRREAVSWYPVVNPAWETDPVGGPVYLQARASILGN